MLVLIAAACNNNSTSTTTPPPAPQPTPTTTNTNPSSQDNSSNSNSQTSDNSKTPTPTPTPAPNPSPTPAPTSTVPSFILSPSSSGVKVGSNFDVQVLLNTAGQSIDGLDIYQLHFDPKLLSLTVTPGTLMPNVMANTVDNTKGTFTFSQVTSPSQHYTGSGVLLTLHFKALKAGTAAVTFDFVAGATNKSDIAAHGVNVLQKVVNGSYTIK